MKPIEINDRVRVNDNYPGNHLYRQSGKVISILAGRTYPIRVMFKNEETAVFKIEELDLLDHDYLFIYGEPND